MASSARSKKFTWQPKRSSPWFDFDRRPDVWLCAKFLKHIRKENVGKEQADRPRDHEIVSHREDRPAN